MRIIRHLLIISALSISFNALGQESADTTIFDVAEFMPRFPICEILDTTIEVKKKCAEEALLAFMYENINYPIAALQENIEGSVVLSFVVEKTGHIAYPEVLRDIGGGCGDEALRVVKAMQEMGMRWVPAIQQGDTVRARVTLPIRFRIEQPLPYSLIDRDTVYTTIDTFPIFTGETSLGDYYQSKLSYPEEWKDSCIAGVLEAQLWVNTNGAVKVLEITDMNELGYDFWEQAVDASISTYGMWKPARFEGRDVPSMLSIAIPFIPRASGCQEEAKQFQQARALEEEARMLVQQEDIDQALTKLDEAIIILPRDASLLLLRGEIYLNRQEYEQACADLSLARQIASTDWYSEIVSIFCR